MTRTRYRTVLLVIGLVAYVWLCREVYLFIEMDSCIDDGGIIDPSTGACDGARSGDTHFFGRSTGLLAWVVLFALPVIPALILVGLANALLYRWAPAPSNSAIDTDAARSPLRAPDGAGHRER